MSEQEKPAVALQRHNIVAVQFGTWEEAKSFFEWLASAGLAEFQRQPGPAPLDPELDAYLDWPLLPEDNEIWCDKPGCPAGCNPPESRGWISQYGMTARGLLTDIRRHAERS